MRLTTTEREIIRQAAREAEARGPVDTAKYDAIDLASDTGNYWWTGVSSYAARIGLRLVTRKLRVGSGTAQ